MSLPSGNYIVQYLGASPYKAQSTIGILQGKISTLKIYDGTAIGTYSNVSYYKNSSGMYFIKSSKFPNVFVISYGNFTDLTSHDGLATIGSISTSSSTSTSVNTLIMKCETVAYINEIRICQAQGGTWDYNSCSCIPRNILTSTSSSTATSTVTSSTSTVVISNTSTSSSTNTSNVLISDCINAGGSWNNSLQICQFSSPTVTFSSTSTFTNTTSGSTSTSNILTSTIYGIPLILIILIIAIIGIMVIIR